MTKAEQTEQDLLHFLPHAFQAAANVDRRALIYPAAQVVGRVPQDLLHIALLRLVTRERQVQPLQQAAVEPMLQFVSKEEVVGGVAFAEQQPAA